MKKILSVVIVVLCVSAGYSEGFLGGSKPTEDDGLRVFKGSLSRWIPVIGGVNYFNESWDSLINKAIVKLVSFTKIDGEGSEIDGVRHYRLNFEAVIENLQGEGDKAPGTQHRLKGNMLFKKTEEGWVVKEEPRYTATKIK